MVVIYQFPSFSITIFFFSFCWNWKEFFFFFKPRWDEERGNWIIITVKHHISHCLPLLPLLKSFQVYLTLHPHPPRKFTHTRGRTHTEICVCVCARALNSGRFCPTFWSFLLGVPSSLSLPLLLDLSLSSSPQPSSKLKLFLTRKWKRMAQTNDKMH